MVENGLNGAIYERSTSSAFSDEACVLQADNRTLYITDTTILAIVRDGTTVVEKDAAVLDSNTYVIIPGGVLFREDQTAGTYTMSGSSSALIAKGGIKDFDLTFEMGVLDDSCKGQTWRTKQPSMIGWSASTTGFWLVDNIADIGADLFFEFYLNTDVLKDRKIVGFAQLDDIKFDTKADDLANETLSIKGDGVPRLLYLT